MLMLMLILILILSSVNTSVRISKLNPIYNITEAPLSHLKVTIYCYYLCSTLRIFRFSIVFCETDSNFGPYIADGYRIFNLSVSPAHLLPFPLSSPSLFSLLSPILNPSISFSFVLILAHSKIYAETSMIVWINYWVITTYIVFVNTSNTRNTENHHFRPSTQSLSIKPPSLFSHPSRYPCMCRSIVRYVGSFSFLKKIVPYFLNLVLFPFISGEPCISGFHFADFRLMM